MAEDEKKRKTAFGISGQLDGSSSPASRVTDSDAVSRARSGNLPPNSIVGVSGGRAGQLFQAPTPSGGGNNTPSPQPRRSAVEEFGAAQRIRAETAASQQPQRNTNPNVTVIGPSRRDNLEQQFLDTQERLSSGNFNSFRDRQNAFVGNEQLRSFLDLGVEREAIESRERTALGEADIFADSRLRESELDNAGALDRTLLDITGRRNINTDDNNALAGLRGAQARLAAAQTGELINPTTGPEANTDIVNAYSNFLANNPTAPPELRRQILEILLGGDTSEVPVEGRNADGGMVERYADGGFVDPSMQRRSTGAVGSAGAMGGDMASMQKYQQYTAKAQELNLPLVGFQEFVQMSGQGPAPTGGMAMGGMVQRYAEGGEVDVSGGMVFDADSAAGTDSIPAVIDGQQIAALDSGEFVIPKNAVLFYGTDKLNKMVAKANEEPQNGGDRSAIGRASRV